MQQNWYERLKSNLLLGHFECSITGMKAKGIPSHINLLNKLDGVTTELHNVSSEIRNNTEHVTQLEVKVNDVHNILLSTPLSAFCNNHNSNSSLSNEQIKTIAKMVAEEFNNNQCNNNVNDNINSNEIIVDNQIILNNWPIRVFSLPKDFELKKLE